MLEKVAAVWQPKQTHTKGKQTTTDRVLNMTKNALMSLDSKTEQDADFSKKTSEQTQLEQCNNQEERLQRIGEDTKT